MVDGGAGGFDADPRVEGCQSGGVCVVREGRGLSVNVGLSGVRWWIVKVIL